MKRVLVVFGARPSAVKLAPVVHALEARGVQADVCLTGQHGEMLECCLEGLGLRPRYHLRGFSARPLPSRIAGMLVDVGEILVCSGDFDAVVVVGDTISGLAGALAGEYADVPVAHVEAGLRTHQREPWPEEMVRRQIDACAHWHFAPTVRAKGNLLAENVSGERLWITGNTIVDSLQKFGFEYSPPETPKVLITIHRRENWPHIKTIVEQVRYLASEYSDASFVWPAHPAIAEKVFGRFKGCNNVLLEYPLPYEDFMRLMLECSLVITDSGGVQEEASTLGIPNLVVRQCTERPEAIEAGVSRLVTNPVALGGAADGLLRYESELAKMRKPTKAFGDGRAGERIAGLMVSGVTCLGEPALC